MKLTRGTLNRFSPSVAAQVLKEAESACARGDLASGERLSKNAEQLDPKSALPKLLLGQIYARSGRSTEAIPVLKAAIALDPQCFPAMAQLSGVLRKQGEVSEAAALAAKVVALAPSNPAGYANLGLARLMLEDFVGATDSLRYAIRIAPKSPELYRSLAMAQRGAGRLTESEATFRGGIALDPRDVTAKAGLAEVLALQERFDEAIGMYEKLLRERNVPPEVNIEYARTLLAMRRFDAAEEVLRNFVEESPNYAPAFGWLGQYLLQTGSFEEARQILTHAIELDASYGLAYWSWAQCGKLTESDRPFLAEMQRAAEALADSPKAAMPIHYALGKGFNDLGDFERAMVHYSSANRTAKGAEPFSRSEFQETVDRLIEVFDKAFFDRPVLEASASDMPIFIVGMMRSGTTLVENMLSAHPDVGRGGELGFWTREAPTILEPQHKSLNPVAAKQAVEKYQILMEGIADGSPHATDKNPLNFLCLGIIHSLFPKAKIIHCRRNPVDTCLSIYFTPLSVGSAYAHDAGDLVFYYREYERLMSHWRRVLPKETLLEIEYADLVNDPSSERLRILNHCGLKAGADHGARVQHVATPSAWQVRQPIYRTSLDRYRNYLPWLGEFAELLSPQAD